MLSVITIPQKRRTQHQLCLVWLVCLVWFVRFVWGIHPMPAPSTIDYGRWWLPMIDGAQINIEILSTMLISGSATCVAPRLRTGRCQPSAHSGAAPGTSKLVLSQEPHHRLVLRALLNACYIANHGELSYQLSPPITSNSK